MSEPQNVTCPSCRKVARIGMGHWCKDGLYAQPMVDDAGVIHPILIKRPAGVQRADTEEGE